MLAFLEEISRNSAFEVLLVYNGDLTNLDQVPETVVSFPNPTQGYDLNCYIRGFLEGILRKKRKFIFINNSIHISNPSIFSNTLITMNKKLEETIFVSFSLSEEIKKHFQTFLFGINLKNDPNSINIISNACKKYDRPFTRVEVIEQFELKTYDYVVDNLRWNYSIMFKPNLGLKFKGYILFLIKLGFLDNIKGLLKFERINYSLFLKKDIERNFGFKKIKSTSVINNWNEN